MKALAILSLSVQRIRARKVWGITRNNVRETAEFRRDSHRFPTPTEAA